MPCVLPTKGRIARNKNGKKERRGQRQTCRVGSIVHFRKSLGAINLNRSVFSHKNFDVCFVVWFRPKLNYGANFFLANHWHERATFPLSWKHIRTRSVLQPTPKKSTFSKTPFSLRKRSRSSSYTGMKLSNEYLLKDIFRPMFTFQIKSPIVIREIFDVNWNSP